MTPTPATIAKGDGSGIVRPSRTVVRDAAEWQALWAAHAGPGSTPPDVDFAHDMVAAAFAGERPTPGYAIEIVGTRDDGSALGIVVKETPAPRGLVAAQVIVSPFHIVRMARHGGEVRFVDESERVAVRAVDHPDPGDQVVRPYALSARAPSSTGLEPNLAAALAYLAGPFSGVLILLVERANGYVRFHAWQSILGLGGLGLLSAATLVLSFLTLLLSPFIFTVMYRFSEVVAIAWVVVWMICLVKAFRGSRWEMPIAGRYAAQLAGRGEAGS
jgi:uncharacterized membrane protein